MAGRFVAAGVTEGSEAQMRSSLHLDSSRMMQQPAALHHRWMTMQAC